MLIHENSNKPQIIFSMALFFKANIRERNFFLIYVRGEREYQEKSAKLELQQQVLFRVSSNVGLRSYRKH